MKKLIIGTAGHIDHGKTSLVKALTGIDGDRLKEEKERGITIELGFAEILLGSGRRASIIDVPGHEKLIRNMIAGATSIDVVLLVVDGNEGVMPQTIEHLQILNGLGVKKGIIVVTKIDKVSNGLIELVEENIKEEVKGSFLERAPIIKTSIVNEKGIYELKEKIDELLCENETVLTNSSFRMYIDRVFTVNGAGTIVTGTALEGKVKEGDDIFLFPKGIKGRVREIQNHSKRIACGEGGNRLAINISGIEKENIKKGDVVYSNNTFQGSYNIECKFTKALNLKHPLKNRERVRFYFGTREILGRTNIISESDGYIKITLEEEVFLMAGDSYFLRTYSPIRNIGGGKVLNTCVNEKYSRVEYLKLLENGSRKEQILNLLNEEEWLSKDEIDEQDYEEMKNIDEIVVIGDREKVLLSQESFNNKCQKIKSLLEEYHKKNNLSIGMPLEELRKRAFNKEIKSLVFNQFIRRIEDKNIIELKEARACLRNFEITLKTYQKNFEKEIESLLLTNEIDKSTYEKVGLKFNIKKDEGNLILELMKKDGIIIQLNEEILIEKDSYEKLVKTIIDFIKANNGGALGELRDLINKNRKVTLSILDKMDEDGLTKRIENRRILNKGFNMLF